MIGSTGCGERAASCVLRVTSCWLRVDEGNTILPFYAKEISGLLNQSHLRMTRQRQVILEVLRNVNTHPRADEVYEMVRKRLPRISLGTIYRNLEILFESGEIHKL
jgi:hypothetical protein